MLERNQRPIGDGPSPERVTRGGLRIAAALHRFVEEEALPGTGVSADSFWQGLEGILDAFGGRNDQLLRARADLQRRLDDYHRRAPGAPEPTAYRAFLEEIGYLAAPPSEVVVTTSDVDREIAEVAGPQLVVPVDNARFAANAANARWGSLYDALYGTDAVPDAGPLARTSGYNAARGDRVVELAKQFLDEHFPLASGRHADVTAYVVDADGLGALAGGATTRLADPEQLVGYAGPADAPTSVLLRHHGLHVELVVDRAHPIGATDPAGLADVVLESAVTAIMDLEDSVAAVDAADKVAAYRNWLALMKGTLSARVEKDGASFTRTLAADRAFRTLDGTEVVLPGRALLFLRQVGHLMTTDAVLDGADRPVPEGILDAVVTALAGVHDLRSSGPVRNSRTGSLYLVKPKMHGPEEVRFTVDLFAAVERLLGLAAGALKLGIMDEERRTSLNLEACLAEAADRVVFINTGFLDRTGDEIRTSTYAGPMVRKGEMRTQPWIGAYESRNVRIGLASGLAGRGQIGKGMWAAPDDMARMLEQKIEHPAAGASCAWVPSPTAATLHALHYHRVDVRQRQRDLLDRPDARPVADLLRIPVGDPSAWSADDRRAELDNNVQGILGYVVRWVDAGIGCSKVPDISGTPLMEDRATCRISSQHVANWLLHGVVTADEVEDSLRRMAAVVDHQNGGDPGYRPMALGFDGPAFQAARDLVLLGLDQPSGYTEPILHDYRRRAKAAGSQEN